MRKLLIVVLALAGATIVAEQADAKKRKVTHSDISIKQNVDKASPSMARKKSYTPSNEKVKYMEYKMDTVTVTSKSGGSSGGPKGSQASQGATKRK